jgi:hypothetical protein
MAVLSDPDARFWSEDEVPGKEPLLCGCGGHGALSRKFRLLQLEGRLDIGVRLTSETVARAPAFTKGSLAG